MYFVKLVNEGNILLIDDYIVNGEGNVVCKSGSSTTSEPLVLIDFEYCNYNYRGFDFGNHFCEYGYDYNCDEPPYYKIYQEKFNVIQERKIFCEAYLEEIYKMRDSHENPHFPSDLVTGDHEKDLATLISESIHFMPVSNLFWACWGLLNAEDSVIAFDYGSYARDRLALYFEQKAELKKYLDQLDTA
uniref:Choline/ethanolamine kinase n=1 Tax=Heterorhabditis bacteriophora TaxID=37862 RepID=A0A1I7XKA8_HETBA